MTINIKPLDNTLMTQAFELATEVFIEAGTLHKALGIGLEQYQSYLREPFKKMVAQGLSIAAIDADSGALPGCLIVTDFAGQPEGAADRPDNFAPLVALTSELEKQYTLQRHVSPGEAIQVDMGAVAPCGRGKGVYKQMRLAINRFAKERGFRWVIGELSSATTQHVVIGQMKHRVVAKVDFQLFEFDGVFPFQAIKEPPGIVLTEGVL